MEKIVQNHVRRPKVHFYVGLPKLALAKVNKTQFAPGREQFGINLPLAGSDLELIWPGPRALTIGRFEVGNGQEASWNHPEAVSIGRERT